MKEEKIKADFNVVRARLDNGPRISELSVYTVNIVAIDIKQESRIKLSSARYVHYYITKFLRTLIQILLLYIARLPRRNFPHFARNQVGNKAVFKSQAINYYLFCLIPIIRILIDIKLRAWFSFFLNK